MKQQILRKKVTILLTCNFPFRSFKEEKKLSGRNSPSHLIFKRQLMFIKQDLTSLLPLTILFASRRRAHVSLVGSKRILTLFILGLLTL